MDRTTGILKKHNLKTTSCRKDVLQILMNEDHALSHADLESEVEDRYDRVTLYRTLKTFEENGLIHKVLDDSGSTKYAPCSSCSIDQHRHEHVHFKCNVCGNTVCLEDVNIPPVPLPKEYSVQERSLLIAGTCNICNKK